MWRAHHLSSVILSDNKSECHIELEWDKFKIQSNLSQDQLREQKCDLLRQVVF